MADCNKLFFDISTQTVIVESLLVSRQWLGPSKGNRLICGFRSAGGLLWVILENQESVSFLQENLHVRVHTNAGSEAGRIYKRASEAAVALRGWGFGDLPMIAPKPESIQHPSPITRRL